MSLRQILDQQMGNTPTERFMFCLSIAIGIGAVWYWWPLAAKRIGKFLYWIAKRLWPDLAQWEQEACRACRVAGSAARKLHVSIHRSEIEPRAEFDSLIAGMGTLDKLMRGPGAPPSGDREGAV